MADKFEDFPSTKTPVSAEHLNAIIKDAEDASKKADTNLSAAKSYTNTEIAKVNTKITQLNDDIQSFESQAFAQFQALNNAVDNLTGTLNGLIPKVTDIDTRLKRVETKVK